MNMVDEYMNEVIPYGGIPVRRADAIRHLQHVGCGPTSVAFAGYMAKPVLDCDPVERWNTETQEWEPTSHVSP